jgi:hypothetical protein
MFGRPFRFHACSIGCAPRCAVGGRAEADRGRPPGYNRIRKLMQLDLCELVGPAFVAPVLGFAGSREALI